MAETLSDERDRIEKQLELLYNSDSINHGKAYYDAIKRLEKRLEEINDIEGYA